MWQAKIASFKEQVDWLTAQTIENISCEFSNAVNKQASNTGTFLRSLKIGILKKFSFFILGSYTHTIPS